ncbi:hypothetical protein, partial [uncultured Mucilaginibacter sp.]|uniref:hypothetical protein n=2 Tax=uncultured Mucilaginibacter sp. TaxID=797541 RepID=UPI0025ECF80F
FVGMLAGESYYKIKVYHTRHASLQFKFDYKKCDGTIGTQPVIVDLSKEGEFADAGSYFYGYEIARQPYDIVLDALDCKEAQAYNSKIDELSKEFDNDVVAYSAKMNQMQNAQSKQLYDAALTRSKAEFAQGMMQVSYYLKTCDGGKLAEELDYLQKVQSQLNKNNLLMDGLVADEIAKSATQPSKDKPADHTVTSPTKSVSQPNNSQVGNSNQQLTNTYLKAARDSSNDAIQKQMYLSLAKNNATASGNAAQKQEIALEQQKFNTEMAEKTVQSVSDGVSALNSMFSKNAAEREKENEWRENLRAQNKANQDKQKREEEEINAKKDFRWRTEMNITDNLLASVNQPEEILKILIYKSYLMRVSASEYTDFILHDDLFYAISKQNNYKIDITDPKLIGVDIMRPQTYLKGLGFKHTLVCDASEFIGDIHQTPEQIPQMFSNQFLIDWYRGLSAFAGFTGDTIFLDQYTNGPYFIHEKQKTYLPKSSRNLKEALEYLQLAENDQLEHDIKIKDIGTKLFKAEYDAPNNDYTSNAKKANLYFYDVTWGATNSFDKPPLLKQILHSRYGHLGLRQMSASALIGELYYDSFLSTSDTSFLYKCYEEYSKSLDYYFKNIHPFYKSKSVETNFAWGYSRRDAGFTSGFSYEEVIYHTVEQNFLMISSLIMSQIKNDPNKQNYYLSKYMTYYHQYYD